MSIHILEKLVLHESNPTKSASVNVRAMLQSWINLAHRRAAKNVLIDLRQDLPVEALFHEDLVHFPTTLYLLLRDFLLVKGLSYQKHPNTNRLINGTSCIFLDDNDDKSYAYHCIFTIRMPSQQSVIVEK